MACCRTCLALRLLHSVPTTSAAVCHGPCALTTAVGADGASILKGKQASSV